MLQQWGFVVGGREIGLNPKSNKKKWKFIGKEQGEGHRMENS